MTGFRYYFNLQPMRDFASLCARFGVKALQSPYRSTVPLLSLVEHGRPVWESLIDSWGVPRGTSLHFEYRAKSPKPRGNPSHTDMMLMSGGKAWAIEAKWTEPRYETVANRLRKPESDGGDPRITLNGWLSYLQPYAGRDLQLEDFSDVVYQTLHRAASACVAAAEHGLQPELVYLHFSPSPLKNSATRDEYATDLSRLHKLLGSPGHFIFRVVDVVLSVTPAFEKIKDLDKHSPVTSKSVREALCREVLFDFGSPVANTI